MIFLPGLSFSASNRRCAGAVKSVVSAGAYSSAAIVAPVFASAALKAATPSRPNALSCAERRDRHARLADRDRVRDRVLRGVARGAEDVAVPLVAGDLVGDRRLDDQDLLALLGDGQHRERRGRRGRADRERDAVVLVGFGERGLGDVGLALVVLGDDDDLAPVDRHRALGGVFEAHAQAGLGLLGVGLERAGLAVDQRDLQVFGAAALPANSPAPSAAAMRIFRTLSSREIRQKH